MKLFKPMTKEEAIKLYNEIKEAYKGQKSSFASICLEDIYFFTDELTKDY